MKGIMIIKMDKKTYYVAVDANGTQRNIESWEKADVLLLLEILCRERMDLYAVLKDCIVSDCKQMGMVGIQCEEPPPTTVFSECIGKKSLHSSFKSELCDAQLETLADLMNEIGFVDYPNPVTKDCLATFFLCEQTGMKVRNLRLFCAMMSALASYGYIGRYWQAPIYKCQLLVAYKKGGYIGRSDLTTAHHAINSVIMDERVEKIVKTIKKLRELKDTDVSV
jgi:hypothetical protein